MIHSPPQLVWMAHGSPVVEGCSEADGLCYVCGGSVARGMLVKKWMSASFSDHARVACPYSPTVCEACVYVMSRTTPVLGRPAGKCSVCEGTLKVVKVPKAGKGSKARKGDDCPKCGGTGMNPGGHGKADCPPGESRSIGASRNPERTFRDSANLHLPTKVLPLPCASLRNP